MKLIVITDDKMVSVEGYALNFDFIIDKNIHAIQWHNTKGEVEFKDYTPNLVITDIAPYQYLVDAHSAEVVRVAEEARQPAEPEIVDFVQLRSKRDELLANSDFRMLSDYIGIDKELWATYRQELRDLPATYVPMINPPFPITP